MMIRFKKLIVAGMMMFGWQGLAYASDAASRCQNTPTTTANFDYSTLRALVGNGLKALIVKSSTTNLSSAELAALANTGVLTVCVDDNKFSSSELSYMIRSGVEVVIQL